MRKDEVIFLTVSFILAAVIGGVIGDIIGSFLPSGSQLKTLFMKGLDIGFETFHVDFFAISFTFGLMVKINFVSILMIILVIMYFRWWHF